MDENELRDFLRRKQVPHEERELEHGTQFRCQSGEIFNVYTTGKVAYQGKTQSSLAKSVRELEGIPEEAAPGEESDEVTHLESGRERAVFIVYGRDEGSRDQLELLLRRWRLDPIVLMNLPAAGDTIIEKLERYLGEKGDVGFACVLLTPDDEGHLAGKPEEKKYRARQNVILELGMVLARLGRRRVAILIKQSVEQPSDIAGLIYIPFVERVDEVQPQLARELRNAGYTPRENY